MDAADEDVLEAVVIIVADGNSVVVTRAGQAGFGRYFGEVPSTVVLEEPVRVFRRRLFEGLDVGRIYKIAPSIPLTPPSTLLAATRDAAAAGHFFQRAVQVPTRPRPRVINVDGNPAYPKVAAELKRERKLGRRCRCRTCSDLNNHLEQDNRAIKRRVRASQGFRSFDGA